MSSTNPNPGEVFETLRTRALYERRPWFFPHGPDSERVRGPLELPADGLTAADLATWCDRNIS